MATATRCGRHRRHANRLSVARLQPHVQVPTVEPRSADVTTIEGIVQARYETISGPIGTPRQWGRDRTLFAPNIRYLSMHPDPKTSKLAIDDLTYQQYLDGSNAFMVKQGFSEVELAHAIHRYGNVATVLSSYESRAQADPKAIRRGVNIFTLYHDGKRWWIQSMLWDEERPDNPIPAELLPKK